MAEKNTVHKSTTKNVCLLCEVTQKLRLIAMGIDSDDKMLA